MSFECPETENQETQTESSPNVIMTRSCTGTDQAARGTGLRGRCGMTYSVTVMTFFEIVIDIPVVIALPVLAVIWTTGLTTFMQQLYHLLTVLLWMPCSNSTLSL